MSSMNHWQSNTFPLNHIIETVLVLHLALSEGENQLLVVLRKDEALECTVVPLDLLYGANRKSDLNVVSCGNVSIVEEGIVYAISCSLKNIL